jgi:hypothetical protein
MLLLDIQKNIVSNFVKLRISNSNLLIEQGRHQNIPLENRLCPICKLEIENEYHFVIEVSNHQLISLRFSLNLCFFEPTWSFYLKFNLLKTIYFMKRT